MSSKKPTHVAGIDPDPTARGSSNRQSYTTATHIYGLVWSMQAPWLWSRVPKFPGAQVSCLWISLVMILLIQSFSSSTGIRELGLIGFGSLHLLPLVLDEGNIITVRLFINLITEDGQFRQLFTIARNLSWSHPYGFLEFFPAPGFS